MVPLQLRGSRVAQEAIGLFFFPLCKNMTKRKLNDAYIQNRQQSTGSHYCGRRTKAGNIRKRLCDDYKRQAVVVSPLVMMFCLLVPSSMAYSPVTNHPSLIFQHCTTGISRSIPGEHVFYRYTNGGDRHERMNRVHPPTQLQKQMHGEITKSEINRMTFIDDRDNEETEDVPMIRKLNNMSQLYDFVTQVDQHNSTVVAEITQRFAHLLSYNNGSPAGASIGSQKRTTNNAEDSDEGELLTVVLKLIISTFNSSSYQHTEQYQYQFDCAECFVGLANILQYFNIRHNINSSQQAIIFPVISQLWNHVIAYEEKVEYSRKHSIVHNISPKKLVSLLLSIHKVSQYSSRPNMMSNMNSSSLVYANICTRLCHGDRINRLNMHDIYQTLKALVTTSSTDTLWNICESPITQRLLIGLVRRMRKPAIYSETSSTSLIIKALHQMQRHWYSIKANSSSNAFEAHSTNLAIFSTLSRVTREIELSMYRLLSHIISSSLPNPVNLSDTTTCRHQVSIKELGILAMTIRIVIPRTFISNTTHGYQQTGSGLVDSNIPAIVQQFQQIVTLQASMTKFPKSMTSTQRANIATIHDISRILRTWKYYQCQLEHAEDDDSHRSNHEMIQSLGLLAEQIVVDGTSSNIHEIRPTDINSIYRTLAFLPKSYPTKPFCSALSCLLVQNENFLQRCSIKELSNFCWFMAFKSHHSPNDSVIIALGNRIVQHEVSNESSPKEASRILSAFTRLCCDEPTAPLLKIEEPDKDSSTLQRQKRSNVLSNLFKCYGEYLLESTDLSPYDASSAIYAYAKAQYVLDMGIFDHLVDIFAKHVQNNPSSCTLRQICQTLWACGKMVSFESYGVNEIDDNYAENKDLPYINGFLVMVTHVIRHAEKLSTQDVTQTLWAISRFNLFPHKTVKYDITIEPILHQVQTLAKQLNADERATLLWTFSRIPAISPLLAKTIFLLTRPFALPLAAEQCTDIVHPEVASIVLYSLGRMNIRDTEVFTYLTNYVLKYQIDTASAQTIANILWAHRSVHIEPPQELLENWTMSKLPNLNIAYGSVRMWP